MFRRTSDVQALGLLVLLLGAYHAWTGVTRPEPQNVAASVLEFVVAYVLLSRVEVA